MFDKIAVAVELVNQEYIKSFTVTRETRSSDLQEIVDF